MADIQKIYELLGKANFEPTEVSTEQIAEEAYLKAEYNSILIEMIMEG